MVWGYIGAAAIAFVGAMVTLALTGRREERRSESEREGKRLDRLYADRRGAFADAVEISGVFVARANQVFRHKSRVTSQASNELLEITQRYAAAQAAIELLATNVEAVLTANACGGQMRRVAAQAIRVQLAEGDEDLAGRLFDQVSDARDHVNSLRSRLLREARIELGVDASARELENKPRLRRAWEWLPVHQARR